MDISLCVDMLSQAHAANYEAAVLVVGDEDYVPLVEAVKALGRQVFVWFVSSGLSPHLKRSADYFFNLDEVLLNESAPTFSKNYDLSSIALSFHPPVMIFQAK